MSAGRPQDARTLCATCGHPCAVHGGAFRPGGECAYRNCLCKGFEAGHIPLWLVLLTLAAICSALLVLFLSVDSPAVDCAEDSGCYDRTGQYVRPWNCETDGNRICGPVGG